MLVLGHSKDEGLKASSGGEGAAVTCKELAMGVWSQRRSPHPAPWDWVSPAQPFSSPEQLGCLVV